MERVTVDQAQSMMRDDIRAMRREYTKMRDIAQKRIQRMGKTQFRETETYKNNRVGFARLRDLDPRDFAKAYSELSKFVTAKGSTIKGQTEIMYKTSRKLNKALGFKDKDIDEKTGMTPGGINQDNYWRMIRILNKARKDKIFYGSDDMKELADLTLGLTREQFDDVLDNLNWYLTHTENVKQYLEDPKNIDPESGYLIVDMKAFREKIGW